MQSLRSSERKVRKSFQFLFFLEEGTKVELFPGKYQKTFETDILKLRADELNFTLCMFVKVGPGRHLCHQSLNTCNLNFQEVKKPNGDQYAADSIFYLVLGIQEYLFEVNICCDLLQIHQSVTLEQDTKFSKRN